MAKQQGGGAQPPAGSIVEETNGPFRRSGKVTLPEASPDAPSASLPIEHTKHNRLTGSRSERTTLPGSGKRSSSGADSTKGAGGKGTKSRPGGRAKRRPPGRPHGRRAARRAARGTFGPLRKTRRAAGRLGRLATGAVRGSTHGARRGAGTAQGLAGKATGSKPQGSKKKDSLAQLGTGDEAVRHVRVGGTVVTLRATRAAVSTARIASWPVRMVLKRVLAAIMIVVLLLSLLGTIIVGMVGDASEYLQAEEDRIEAETAAAETGNVSPSLIAENTDIPIEAARAYVDAAYSFEMDWAILAGVSYRECRHGESEAEGCNPDITSDCTYSTDESQDGHPCTAKDGEQGPMQFLAATWRSGTAKFDRDRVGAPAADGKGYATDGSGDGAADPFDWFDAAHSSARYLVELGVNDDEVKALNRYNGISQGSGLTAYSRPVMEKVEEYRQAVPSTGGFGDVDFAGCPSASEEAPDSPQNSDATNAMRAAVASCFGRWGNAGCFNNDAWRNDEFEHPRGRACDFMVGGSEKAQGDQLAAFVKRNAEDLNVLYVIWYRRIWSPDQASQGWRPYSGDSPHTDHVHVSVSLQPGDPYQHRCEANSHGGAMCTD